MKNTIIFDNRPNFRPGDTLVFFVSEKLSFETNTKNVSPIILNKIKAYLKVLKYKKKGKEKIVSFDLSEENKALFVIVKNNPTSGIFRELGAEFFSFLKNNKIYKINLYADSLKSTNIKEKNNVDPISNFIHGFKLKSYSFDKYKTDHKKNFYSFKIISPEKKILNSILNISQLKQVYFKQEIWCLNHQMFCIQKNTFKK